MRILQVHTRYRQRGGEDVVVEAEADLLRQAGHEVRQVIAQNPQGSVRAAANLAFAPWNPYWVHRIRREVESFRPDVVHVHNTWFTMSPAVLRAAKQAGAAVVMTLHNYRLTCANALLFRDGTICEDCVGASPWPAVRHACYRGSRAQSFVAAATVALHRNLGTWVRHVDRFIALTDFQRNLMIRAGFPADRVVVKPNFVPDPGPRPSPPSASNVVLYVGRLSYEKGVDLLIDAWRRARTQHLELWVAGCGPLATHLYQERVHGIVALGEVPRSKVWDLLFSARALAMPSIGYETFGLSIVEACAAALPVLLNPQMVIVPQIQEHRPGGLIATRPDRPSWIVLLEKVTDGEMCDVLGDANRHRFERKWSAASNCNALVSVYEEARRV